MTGSSAPASTARERQRLETREAVLRAAVDLFAVRGFEGVALDDIAVASGIRKNTLLYHFGSKEDLWRRAVDWLFAQVGDRFQVNTTTRYSDRWEGFQHVTRVYLDICLEFPAYVLLPTLEGASESWRTEYLAKNYLRPHAETFRGYVSKLIADGVLPAVDPLHLQNLLTGGAQNFLGMAPAWKAAIGKDTASRKFIHDYAATVFSLIAQARPAKA